MPGRPIKFHRLRGRRGALGPHGIPLKIGGYEYAATYRAPLIEAARQRRPVESFIVTYTPSGVVAAPPPNPQRDWPLPRRFGQQAVDAVAWALGSSGNPAPQQEWPVPAQPRKTAREQTAGALGPNTPPSWQSDWPLASPRRAASVEGSVGSPPAQIVVVAPPAVPPPESPLVPAVRRTATETTAWALGPVAPPATEKNWPVPAKARPAAAETTAWLLGPNTPPAWQFDWPLARAFMPRAVGEVVNSGPPIIVTIPEPPIYLGDWPVPRGIKVAPPDTIVRSVTEPIQPPPPAPTETVTPGWPVKHWHGPLGEYPQTKWPDWDARKGYRLRLRDGRVIQVRDHLEFLRTGAHFIGQEAVEAVNRVTVKKPSKQQARTVHMPTPETAELMNQLLLERGILEIDTLINLLAVNRQMVLQDEADFLAVIGQML